MVISVIWDLTSREHCTLDRAQFNIIAFNYAGDIGNHIFQTGGDNRSNGYIV